MSQNPIEQPDELVDETPLRQLLNLYCDGRASDEDIQELEEMLRSSSAARRVYLNLMYLHSGLDWLATSAQTPVLPMSHAMDAIESNPDTPMILSPAMPSTDTSTNSSPLTLRLVTPLVTLLSLAVLFIVTWHTWNSVAFRSSFNPSPESKQLADTLASLTHASIDAHWSVVPNQRVSDNLVRAGDVVELDKGEIQLSFLSGASLTMLAPAVIEVLSPMQVRAVRGRLSVSVTSDARGFAIETPNATVVDLGTIFGIEVGDSGATDVVVMKGAVDLHFAAQASEDSNQDGPLRLASGQAMHIDQMGTQSRIVSIFSDRFSFEQNKGSPSTSATPLITAVTDKLDRDQATWNYYEIVVGGMREDAPAFVDRVAHEWNGLTSEGMPTFLLGGDYIKTFNDDKIVRDIDIAVTIDKPCNLYVLFDDRASPPKWLTEQFVDTGFDIGVDVGPFHNVENGTLKSDRLPGVGPGVSVDDGMSVWKMVVHDPRVIHLGSNGGTEHQKVNMYGIVATSLEE